MAATDKITASRVQGTPMAMRILMKNIMLLTVTSTPASMSVWQARRTKSRRRGKSASGASQARASGRPCQRCRCAAGISPPRITTVINAAFFMPFSLRS